MSQDAWECWSRMIHQCDGTDLSKWQVIGLGKTDSSPWSDSTVDPSFPAVVVCRRVGFGGEQHFHHMVDTEGPLSLDLGRNLMAMALEILLVVKESSGLCRSVSASINGRLTCRWWCETLRPERSVLWRYRELRGSAEPSLFTVNRLKYGQSVV